MGDFRGGVALYDRAIDTWEPLLEQGDPSLISNVAWAKARRGQTLLALGEKLKGLGDLRSARDTLQGLAEPSGRAADLQERLARVEEALARQLGQ